MVDINKLEDKWMKRWIQVGSLTDKNEKSPMSPISLTTGCEMWRCCHCASFSFRLSIWHLTISKCLESNPAIHFFSFIFEDLVLLICFYLKGKVFQLNRYSSGHVNAASKTPIYIHFFCSFLVSNVSNDLIQENNWTGTLKGVVHRCSFW